MAKINLKSIFFSLAILLAVILVINIALTINVGKELRQKTEEQKEKLRPGKIELTLIKNSKCGDCFDVSGIISSIKKYNVNVTKETTLEFDSKDGKELLVRHRIEKVPTVIVTGEIEKANVQGLEKKENALLLTKLDPPYTNATTGKIEGRVNVYNLVDAECRQCSNLTTLISQIKSGGVKIFEERKVTADSSEGKELISKYKIDFAPTIILSKELKAYPAIDKAWLQVGTKESDGSYVMRTPSPPFINLTSNQLRGLVAVTYLIDNSCAGCFDVKIYKNVLENPRGFAVKFGKEERFDISDAKAKELISKYNITQIPTVILSDETNVYPAKQALKQFFSVENNGYYVFRKVSVLGTYKDLATNQIISKSTAKATT